MVQRWAFKQALLVSAESTDSQSALHYSSLTMLRVEWMVTSPPGDADECSGRVTMSSPFLADQDARVELTLSSPFHADQIAQVELTESSLFHADQTARVELTKSSPVLNDMKWSLLGGVERNLPREKRSRSGDLRY